MFTASDNTTLLLLLVALGVIGWGYYKARPYGKLGLLSWLQSVVLVVPWLLFFGLSAFGLYLNLAVVLALLLAATGLYIILGRQARMIASQEPPKKPEPNTQPLEQDQSAASHQAQGSPHTEGEQATPQPVPTLSDSVSVAQNLALIPAAELKDIQGIFGVDTFFVTGTVPYQEGIIFKGNLRADPEVVYSRLTKSLIEKVGDRFRLFFVEDHAGKPVVIVLPHQHDPPATTLPQKALSILLMLATVATTFEAGGLLLGFDFFAEPTRYLEVLPIALGVIAILVTHEVAHQVAAQRHNVKFGWPFFIPIIQVGTFGACNRFESLVPNRKVLFDVAFAGPAAGGLLSLGIFLTGLVLSHGGSSFQISTQFFQSSVLVGTLAKAILGAAIAQPVVNVNPLTLIGWLGLIINGINLMPAGTLDGGRIMQAIYGRKIAGRSTLATFAVLAIASFVNPLAFYWAVVILILQRNLERPNLNELSEPDDTRAALGLLALFLMIAILFPFTPALAARFGIGG
ncbi:MAG: site-2 protease family protein [Microcoleaceae cyanobacterium]